MPATGQNQSPRRRALAVAALVGMLAVVVAASAWLIDWHPERAAWQEQVAAYEAQVQYAQAHSASTRARFEHDYQRAADDLAAVIVHGEDLYVASNDQIVEDSLRMELLLATNEGQSILATEPTYLTRTMTVPGIRTEGAHVSDARPGQAVTITTGTTPAISDLEARTAAITETITAVENSQQAAVASVRGQR